ncbi:MAG: HAMP domain-containing histidine kinase [Planctomycetaceae bacterium]|nr:HAMP domain-containing histidine kinase [Planctomycetaceae bacterium]
MGGFRRKRSHLKLPIWTSVVLASLNITLMVVLIVQLAQQHSWLALILGTIAMGISLFGISFYSFLTIKEIQLNRRQSNFVDSVTHELKTPIAALRLYLDTLLMRELSDQDRREFYETMETELHRLDQLINQLLEVGRLDAIGSQTEPERVELETVLRNCAELACRHHKQDLAEVFTFELAPLTLHARRMLLEMVFGNLMDNAVKYGGSPPKVHVSAFGRGRERVIVRVRDNGTGVPDSQRGQIFQMFFRGSDELQRTRKGTGLGLYIVRTLVTIMKGRVTVSDGPDGTGSVFEVSLPGRYLLPGSATSPDRRPTERERLPDHRTPTAVTQDNSVGE